MVYRIITGTVYHTTGLPWSNASISIKRLKGSFTPETQYPQDIVHCTTDAQGRLTFFNGTTSIVGIPLWCNEEGIVPTVYDCVFPDGEKFSFTLPVGTDSIDLSILRNYGISVVQGRIKFYFSYGDATPIIVAPNFTGLIYSSSIVVRSPFNGSASVSLGDAQDTQRLISATNIDTTTVAQYQTFPNHQYTNANILLSLTISGSTTQGSGIAILEI